MTILSGQSKESFSPFFCVLSVISLNYRKLQRFTVLKHNLLTYVLICIGLFVALSLTYQNN